MPTLGVDVSSYQGIVNWEKVRKADMRFAFAKATEGLHHVDASFKSNWSGIGAQDLYRGAYHYGHPGTDPNTQATHFHSVVGTLGDRDLPPVLDLETSDGHAPSYVVDWTLRFVERAEALFRRPVMIYTGGFWRRELGDPKLSQLSSRPLWIAQYRNDLPTVPVTWSAWTFWQYSDGTYANPGPVPGIDGHCDRNRFRGEPAELAALAMLGAPLPLGMGRDAWPGRYFVWPAQPSVQGADVQIWHDRMRKLGFELAGQTYDQKSKHACMAFQRNCGLNVDGIVGPKTWGATFANSD